MTSGPGGDRLYTYGSDELVDEHEDERERAEIEAEWRRRARERAAEIGPISAGDPHPRTRVTHRSHI